ncbi:MAG TPA: FHA domain-containing protein [Thermoanaerobaculia bacterium]|nr:FHA domain-containing protein [Thermoanaerobaculia bacterium]
MQVILQGSLRHFPAAELLTFLLHRSQTGTLDLDNSGRRTRVLFENDHIVWAESNKVPDATEAVLDVLAWDAGTFTLLDSFALPETATRLALALPALVEEARKRAEGYRDDTLFRVVENPAQQQVSLSGEQFKILFRLSGGRTLAELVSDLQMDRATLAKGLKTLEELGLVESGREVKAPEPIVEHPFAKTNTAPIPKQEDAEVTRVERAVITRNTLAPKSIARKNTLVGSLTPDDNPDSVFPLLDSECIIGRASDCAITVTDGSISSRHARVTRSPDGFSIEDLGSRNGTFVNGEKVDKPRLLADGDVVRLGKLIMTFNVAQEQKAEPKTQMQSLE